MNTENLLKNLCPKAVQIRVLIFIGIGGRQPVAPALKKAASPPGGGDGAGLGLQAFGQRPGSSVLDSAPPPPGGVSQK